MSHTVNHPGSPALDRFLETVIRRGVHIIATALVLVGPLYVSLAVCAPAHSGFERGLFNPSATLTTERISNNATPHNNVAPR